LIFPLCLFTYFLLSENVYWSYDVCIYFFHTNFHHHFFFVCSTLAYVFSFHSKFQLLVFITSHLISFISHQSSVPFPLLLYYLVLFIFLYLFLTLVSTSVCSDREVPVISFGLFLLHSPGQIYT
jgi:hypothetical protein